MNGSDSFLIPEHRVHLFPNRCTAIGFEISKSTFEVRVSHPLLYRAKINAVPQRPCRKCRPELVQPKVVRMQFGTLRYGLALVQKVHLGLAA